ncbi:hypothetical protein [Bacillus sp. SG-1]|uniref:hypothetical protein n=1 Tax=Bacillus sp. SG-1 TaxID=161544 RepID=UPI0001543CFF|nr:hypothetical protein [Bacillus sp. SG-1]EDL65611.1 hypothetical protein BSG1_00895 [Bacillus sp. SG-1]
MILKRIINEQENIYKKSVLQTTQILLWILLFCTFALMGNLFLEVNSYGIDIGINSTLQTLNLLTEPLFSPLYWGWKQESSFGYLILNGIIFYVFLSFAFWMKSMVQWAGVVFLLMFFIMAGAWYYVYILSYVAF